MSNKFSEVVGVRLGRWTGVGCAKREVWTEAQRRSHVALYAQRESVRSHKSRTRCFWYCVVRREHETGHMHIHHSV